MAVTERPYILISRVVLPGNTRGTVRFSIGLTEEFNGERMWFRSTGAFSVEAIKDNTGVDYSNATVDTPIPSTMLFATQFTGEGIGRFAIPLYLAPGTTLEIALLDISGAQNTINIAIEGKKKVL